MSIDDRDYLLIGGRRVQPHSTTFVEVRSPSTGEVIGRAPLADDVDVALAVAAARQAFDRGPWPLMAIDERRKVLLRAADLLEGLGDELNDLVTAETGALHRNRGGHIAARVRYLASLEPPRPEVRVASNGEQALIVHEPVGVVAAIVPWNAPVNLSVTKVLPALLTGCTVVLKPAPETPLTAYPLAEALLEAGLPEGALNVVAADRASSELLISHPDVDHVSFTGSTATGRRIAAICGDQVKRVGLELGGKSPAIILDDANLAEVAPAVLNGGMLLNNGQACCAWTRILVPRARHDEVVDAFRAIASDVTIGDPYDPATDLGPMISSQHREKVEGYVRLAGEEGATVVRPPVPGGLERGWFVAPAVLAHATNAMRSSREEIFGPVVSVIPYDAEADAVAIANDSNYGLSAAVFTSDQRRGVDIASRIRSGTVGVNSLAFNIEFPFGGFKQSGIGRQHGPEGLLEYLEIKSIGVPAGADTPALAQTNGA